MDTDDDTPPIFTICKDGDVLLQAKDGSGRTITQYRVSSARLMDASKYYQKLIQSDFSEGQQFRKDQDRLHKTYEDLNQVHASELPAMTLPLPEGVTQQKVVLSAVKLFLKAMHLGKHTQQEEEEREFLLHALSSDINLFAHVVAVSDQLDASHVVQYVAEQILEVQPMCQKRPKKGDAASERYWRQLLYIAYLQRQAKAFCWISGTIILYGLDCHDNQSPDAPWHNLPNNIEEEMAIRREGIFNTISSIPNSLLKPYMQSDKSRPAICKLGYGNSLACDSFQLGESIRWLCRRKFTSPNLAMIYASPEDESFIAEGTPRVMVKALREFPDYQIDGHHHRCGIKGKLIQILDSLESMLVDAKQVGLCLHCWRSKGRDRVSWSMDRRPNAIPYQGNLARDLRFVQTLRTNLADKLASHQQQQNSVKDNSESAESDVNDAQRWLRILPSSNDSPGDTSPGLSTSVLTKSQQSDVPLNPSCLHAYDHVLYAKVFTAERWIEKVWLTGDDAPPESIPSPSSHGKSPRR